MKKYQVDLITGEDGHFSKPAFKGIKINSDNDLNFEYYEDALAFIGDITNKQSSNTDVVISSYFIYENKVDTFETSGVLKSGTISIPNYLLSNEVIDYYLECQKDSHQ